MKRLKAFIIGLTLFVANIAGQFMNTPTQSAVFEKYQYINNHLLISNTKKLACADIQLECK